MSYVIYLCSFCKDMCFLYCIDMICLACWLKYVDLLECPLHKHSFLLLIARIHGSVQCVNFQNHLYDTSYNDVVMKNPVICYAFERITTNKYLPLEGTCSKCIVSNRNTNHFNHKQHAISIIDT